MTATMKSVLNIPVSFAGVSIGTNTARIGVTVDREWLNIMSADEHLCDHRLIGRLVACKEGVDPNQASFVDTGDKHEIAGAFDVKGFRVSSKSVAFGLTFSLNDIDIEELPHLAKQTGRLIVDNVSQIPEADRAVGPLDDDENDDEDGDEEQADAH